MANEKVLPWFGEYEADGYHARIRIPFITKGDVKCAGIPLCNVGFWKYLMPYGYETDSGSKFVNYTSITDTNANRMAVCKDFPSIKNLTDYNTSYSKVVSYDLKNCLSNNVFNVTWNNQTFKVAGVSLDNYNNNIYKAINVLKLSGVKISVIHFQQVNAINFSSAQILKEYFFCALSPDLNQTSFQPYSFSSSNHIATNLSSFKYWNRSYYDFTIPKELINGYSAHVSFPIFTYWVNTSHTTRDKVYPQVLIGVNFY